MMGKGHGLQKKNIISTSCLMTEKQRGQGLNGAQEYGHSPVWIWPDRGNIKHKGVTEDEMVGWHHRLNGHEFERALADGGGQGSLACCGPWGHRVRHD